MHKLAAIAGVVATLLVPAAHAAAVTDIRIAPRGDHVRVVVELDAPVKFQIGEDGSLAIEGLDGDNAVVNASASEAPLKRVVLTPASGGAKLAFETAAPTATHATLMKPDKSGGNRLVVDLYPKDKPTAPPAPPPTLAPAAAQAPAETTPSPNTPPANKSPAVGTTAALPPATTEVPEEVQALPPPTPGAAVPNMPPDASVEMPGTAASFGPAGPLDQAPQPILTNSGPGYSDDVLRAERALDRGDAKDACARAGDLLKVNPKDLRALVVLGACKLALGDAIGAKGAYLTALEADPTFDRARVGLATADDMMGDHVAARTELSKVLGHNVPPEDLAKLLTALGELPAPKAPGQAGQ